VLSLAALIPCTGCAFPRPSHAELAAIWQPNRRAAAAALHPLNCLTLPQSQAAAANERQEVSAAELAAARRRTADAAAGSGVAAERAALWEGRAAGLQAKVCPPCSSTISPVVEPEVQTATAMPELNTGRHAACQVLCSVCYMLHSFVDDGHAKP
jgi:hypothetical protein